jgi:hypothetical protein
MFRFLSGAFALVLLVSLPATAGAQLNVHTIVGDTGKRVGESLDNAGTGPQLASAGNPDCEELKGWIASGALNGTFEPFPKVSLSNLFQDSSFQPVFGRSAMSLSHDEFNALQRKIFDCRKEAAKARDKESVGLYGTGLKVTKKANRAMGTLWKAQINAERSVNSLLTSGSDPGFAPVLTIAQKALNGAETGGDVAQLEPRLGGLGKQAAALSAYRPYLSEAEISGYVSKLSEAQDALDAATAVREEKLAALLKEINSVPVSKAGLSELYGIANRTDIGSMTREDAAAYNQAFQTRRSFIDRQLAQQQAQAQPKQTLQPQQQNPNQQAVQNQQPRQVVDNAAGSVSVKLRIDELLVGDAVDEVSVRGVHPGMTLADAANLAERKLGLRNPAGQTPPNTPGGWNDLPDNLKNVVPTKFGATRETSRSLYKNERRDGGALKIDPMERKVGGVRMTERYAVPLSLSEARDALIARFGEPDRVQTAPQAVSLSWDDAPQHLQVTISNALDRLEAGVDWGNGRGTPYKSKITIGLWNDNYVEYVAEQRKRCKKIEGTPRNQLSMDDMAWFTAHCL